jgi:hypothetical protein
MEQKFCRFVFTDSSSEFVQVSTVFAPKNQTSLQESNPTVSLSGLNGNACILMNLPVI